MCFSHIKTVLEFLYQKRGVLRLCASPSMKWGLSLICIWSALLSNVNIPSGLISHICAYQIFWIFSLNSGRLAIFKIRESEIFDYHESLRTWTTSCHWLTLFFPLQKNSNLVAFHWQQCLVSKIQYFFQALTLTCLVLHYYSFNDGDVVTTFLSTGTFCGFVVILLGGFFGN